MLLAIVAFVTLAAVVVEPSPCRRMPEPFDAAAVVGLVIVLLEIVALLSVPLKLCTSTPCQPEFSSELPVIVRVPEMLFSVPATAVLKAMLD